MKVYIDNRKLESYDIQPITDLGGKKFQQIRMWLEDTNNVEIVSITDHDKELLKEIANKIADKMLKRLNGVCQGNYSEEHKDGYSHCVADIGDYLLELKEEIL